MRNLYLLGILVIALVGCGDGFKVLRAVQEGASTCELPTAVSQSLLENSVENLTHSVDRKVSVESFLLNSSLDGQSSTASLLDFKKGDKVTVVVDSICMMERLNSNGYFLTENIQVRLKNHKHSFQESFTLTLPKAVSSKVLQAYAEVDDCVVLVSPDVTHYTSGLPNDPHFGSQTHLPALDYNTNYDWFYAGAKGLTQDTTIAIIDNGVDINHPDLKNILWVNSAEKNGMSGVDDDRNGYIDDIYGFDFATNVGDPNHKYPSSNNPGHSHGSHVAGLAAAHTDNSTGIAGVMSRKVKIMSLNVFGNSEGARTADIDNAIRYAVDMGAKVLNLSLGGRGAAPSTESALRYAVSKGATVVVAAGNDSQTLSSSMFYTPASYGVSINGLITVGATDSNPTRVGNLCSFSNRSTTYVEVGGPGCDTSQNSMGVLSLYRGGQYGYMAGTSMASPVVAGVATLLYGFSRDAYGKTLTPAEVEDALKKGSKNYTALNSYISQGKNVHLGHLKDYLEGLFGPLYPPVIPPEPPEEPPKNPGC